MDESEKRIPDECDEYIARCTQMQHVQSLQTLYDDAQLHNQRLSSNEIFLTDPYSDRNSVRNRSEDVVDRLY